MAFTLYSPGFNILSVAVLSLLGSLIVYLLKRFFISPTPVFIPDWDGIFERTIIINSILFGLVFIIPITIITRVIIYFFMRKPSEVILRKAPTNEFQKTKTKMEFGLDLFVSPLFAIICGLVLANFKGF